MIRPLDDVVHLETNNLKQLGLIETYIAGRLETVSNAARGAGK